MFNREFQIRFTLAGVGKALCFSPVVVCLVYLVVCLPWDSQHAPSWVQAAGALTAIGVAIAVPWKLRVDELARQATAQRSAELGQYFKLSKIIGLTKDYASQLTSTFGQGLYGPNRLMLYELFKDVQQQLSALHMATNDRLLLKLVVDMKSELARYTVFITPDDISSRNDQIKFISNIQEIQTQVDGYIAREESGAPERVGVSG